MMSESLKLDAYIRVSKVAGRTGESFISPTVQRDRIQAWADLHDRRLVWHEPELDVSGGRMDRPIFESIMGRVRAGDALALGMVLSVFSVTLMGLAVNLLAAALALSVTAVRSAGTVIVAVCPLASALNDCATPLSSL